MRKTIHSSSETRFPLLPIAAIAVFCLLFFGTLLAGGLALLYAITIFSPASHTLPDSDLAPAAAGALIEGNLQPSSFVLNDSSNSSLGPEPAPAPLILPPTSPAPTVLEPALPSAPPPAPVPARPTAPPLLFVPAGPSAEKAAPVLAPAALSQSGFYSLKSDLSAGQDAPALNVSASNVVIDGGGHEVTGHIYLSGNNVTLHNIVLDPSYGLILNSTNDSSFSNLTITNVGKIGIYLTNGASRNSFIGVRIAAVGNGSAFVTEGGSSNLLDCQGGALNGSGAAGTYGILARQASSLTVRNCIVSNFSRPLYLNSSSAGAFSNNTLQTLSADANDSAVMLESNSASNFITLNQFGSASANGIHLGSGQNNIFTANTIVLPSPSAASAIYAAAPSGNNTFLYNNLTAAAWVSDWNGTNSYDAPTCYQESANVSTACGGLGTGSYALVPSYLYINYSKPSGASGALWQVKHGYLAPYNVSIPSECWNASASMLQLRFYAVASQAGGARGTSYGQCYNGSGWENITSISTASDGSASGVDDSPQNLYDGDWSTYAAYHASDAAWHSYYGGVYGYARLYEEAMYWDMHPGNIYYFQNNTGSWNVYNLIGSASGHWADMGADRPFSSATAGAYFSGLGNPQDRFPYTEQSENSISACMPFSSSGGSYHISADLSSPSSCFNILAPNVTLDCQGHSIRGLNASNTYGVIASAPNATIKNCVISNFSGSILLNNSNASTITNNTLSSTYAPGLAGALWTQQSSAGSGGWYALASSADGSRLAAAPSGSGSVYIYTSNDSGMTWAQSGAPAHQYLSIASSSDGTKLAAVDYAGTGNGGYIYTSGDAGATWVQRTGAGSRHWASIASSSDGTRLLASTGGGWPATLFTSSDSGATWTPQEHWRTWQAVASSADGSKLAAAAQGGYIYTSSDGGESWTEQTGSGARNWNALVSSADGTKLAAATYDTTIYTSTDSGLTWVQQNNSGTRNWQAMASSSDGSKLAAVAYDGSVYASGDYGANWMAYSPGGTHFEAVASSADGSRLFAGDRGANNGYLYSSLAFVSALKLASSSGVGAFNNTIRASSAALSTDSNSSNSLFLYNNITASLWVYDAGSSNSFNSSSSGNIYYFPNGTASWSVFNITDTGNDNWADTGLARPFGPSTTNGYFAGFGNPRDWFPYTSVSQGNPPACTNPAQANCNYTLAQDIFSTTNGISITAPNVTLDCHGHSIRGLNASNTYGVIASSSNATIKNCVISNFSGGILLQHADFSVITNNTLLSTYAAGPAGALWVQQSGAGSGGWYALASSADGSRLAAAPSGSGSVYIYTSNDSGMTWAQSGAPAHQYLSIASSADGTRLAAVDYTGTGNGGYIYTSNDSGATWVQRTGAGARHWASIASSSDGTRLLASTGGGWEAPLFLSNDSGATWTGQESSTTWQAVASSSDGMHLAAAVQGGYIYTSNDSGTTWVQRASSGARNWNALVSSADGTKLAAATYDSIIYTSGDYGATWTAQNNSGIRNWQAMASSSDGSKLAAVAYDGSVYASGDYGANWMAYSPGGTHFEAVASSADGSRLFAADRGANNGYLYASSNLSNALELAGSNGVSITNNAIRFASTALFIGPGSSNALFLSNNLTASVWVHDLGPSSLFNNSNSGNIYYFPNGTGSWSLFNISSTSASNWANAGSDRPFSSSGAMSAYWLGNGSDWFPFTMNTS